MIRTTTKYVDGKNVCIYCTKPAKSDSSGSMHNGDWDEFWACDCNGIIEADLARQEIRKLEEKAYDLSNKHTKYFNRKELEKKQQDLKDEYRYKI